MIDIDEAIRVGAQLKIKHEAKARIWRAVLAVFTIAFFLLILFISKYIFFPLQMISFIFPVIIRNIFEVAFLIVWIGFFFGSFAYLERKSILYLYDTYTFLPVRKIIPMYVIGLYGIITGLLDLFATVSYVFPSNPFEGYYYLSVFYTIDQCINPISALKKTYTDVSPEEAQKLRFLDNYALAHVYRQLYPLVKK